MTWHDFARITVLGCTFLCLDGQESSWSGWWFLLFLYVQPLHNANPKRRNGQVICGTQSGDRWDLGIPCHQGDDPTHCIGIYVINPYDLP